ncbi:MAG: hypothetical protein WKG00_18375 [Polyangiaceae bacterium]
MLPEGELLEATTTEEAFLASKLGRRTTPAKGGPGHRNHHAREVLLEGTSFVLGAYFHDGRIIMIILCAGLPNDPRSWDEWSLEREMERKNLHDSWLRARLGDPPWSFSWGSIWSDYDARSAGSSWGINFGR